MLTPDDAARRIVDRLRPLASERIALREALGRVLSDAVVSPISLPPWSNSAMDGYAARSADVRGATEHAPALLTVIEEIPAGQFPARTVGPGEATRIFTGAPVPDGVDCVIRQEDTARKGDGIVAVLGDRDAGRNIRPRGEDIAAGETVFSAGTALEPAQLGVLASIGAAEISVFRRPRIAILSTGDEIADLDEREAILAGEKIASSNSYTLAASIVRSGGTPLNLGIAADDGDDLRQHLERASDADVLVTTAGVSVGEHDHVRTVLDEMGLDLAFWRIRMRPGSPFGFGMLGDLPWIGLPGNPVSTMVTYELFAHPAIRKLAGHLTSFRRTIPVVTGEPITLGPPLRHFLRCRLRDEAGETVATLTGSQGSGLLTSMARADALLVIPEDSPAIPAGARLAAIRFGDPVHVGDPPW